MTNLVIKNFNHIFNKSTIIFYVKNNGQILAFEIESTNSGYDSERYTVNGHPQESYIEEMDEYFKHWSSEDLERLEKFIDGCGQLVYKGWVL